MTSPTSPTPDTSTPNPLAGYGLPSALADRSIPRKGCCIDLGDATLRAAAVATGLVWSGPASAQHKAVADMIAGRIPLPASHTLPDWVRNTLDSYEAGL